MIATVVATKVVASRVRSVIAHQRVVDLESAQVVVLANVLAEALPTAVRRVDVRLAIVTIGLHATIALQAANHVMIRAVSLRRIALWNAQNVRHVQILMRHVVTLELLGKSVVMLRLAKISLQLRAKTLVRRAQPMLAHVQR